jgi:hypothetical protein
MRKFFINLIGKIMGTETNPDVQQQPSGVETDVKPAEVEVTGRQSWTCNTTDTKLNTALTRVFKLLQEKEQVSSSKNEFLQYMLYQAVNAVEAGNTEAPVKESVRDQLMDKLSAIPGLMAVYEARKNSEMETDFEGFIFTAVDFAVNHNRNKSKYKMSYAVPDNVKVDFGPHSFINKIGR